MAVGSALKLRRVGGAPCRPVVEGMVVGRRGTVAAAVLAILAERGPLELDELARLVAEQGATRARRPEVSVRRAVDRESRVVPLLDGRLVSVPALLEGAVLSHRLDQEEADSEFLPVDPDLAPLAPLAVGGLRLGSGRWLERCGEGHLHGPSGWLGACKAGELVGLSLRGGVVEVGPAHLPVEVEGRGVRRLAAVVERELSALGPMAVGEGGLAVALPLALVVLQAMVEAPGLLRHVTAPLGEVLAEAGFETRSFLVGRSGTDWREWDGILGEDGDGDEEEGTVADAAELLGVDERAVEGAGMIIGLLELCASKPAALGELRGSGGLAGRLAQVLGVAGVAELVRAFGLEQPSAEGVLGAVAEAASGRLQAPPTWLLGRMAEQRGDPVAAEALDLRAAEADPGFAPAWMDAARAAEDRGDARGARQRLLRAGVDRDDPRFERVERYARLRPAGGVGRNAPCPCGSGRKYKQCCLQRAALGLRDRAVWLLERAAGWATLPAQRQLVAGLLADGDGELLGVLAEDVALFDRGALAGYLQSRAPLLQADEVALAQRWLGTERGIWEVQRASAGRRVRLRNLRSGEVAEVTRRSPEAPLARLDLLYARVGPDGSESGRMLLSGTVKLHRMLRGQLQQFMEGRPTGAQVLDWFREALRPRLPAMVNFEGEPILLSTARYRVADPAAAAERLRKRLVEESEGIFLETAEVDGRPVHRGLVRLDGETIEIQTNSAERLRRLERLVRWVAPDACLLGREQHSAGEAMASWDPAAASPPTDLPAEAVVGALEAFMTNQEERWVDEPVPALGGLSPRQAAANPARRPVLEALLDDFEWMDTHAGPGEVGRGMDPARLRKLLGLPAGPR
jgi:hypothetical protein